MILKCFTYGCCCGGNTICILCSSEVSAIKTIHLCVSFVSNDLTTFSDYLKKYFSSWFWWGFLGQQSHHLQIIIILPQLWTCITMKYSTVLRNFWSIIFCWDLLKFSIWCPHQGSCINPHTQITPLSWMSDCVHPAGTQQPHLAV